MSKSFGFLQISHRAKPDQPALNLKFFDREAMAAAEQTLVGEGFTVDFSFFGYKAYEGGEDALAEAMTYFGVARRTMAAE